MTTSKPEVKKIAELIKVLNGGIEFYQNAKDKIDRLNIKSTFDTMIFEKQKAVEALQPFAIVEQGEIENDTAFAVDARQQYTKLLDTLTSDTEHTYIKQLEEVEDKVLEKFDSALEENQPAACAIELRRLQAIMQRCHDEMKALQHATE